jgi:hypothetical protein
MLFDGSFRQRAMLGNPLLSFLLGAEFAEEVLALALEKTRTA